MNIAIQTIIMKLVLKILSPSSLAFDSSNNRKISLPEFIKGDQIYKKLTVGDIIFTSTPSKIYEMARKFVDVQYDHVAVVINQSQAIHISPPLISKISLRYLTLPNHYPVIYRPKISKQQLNEFIIILHSFLGDRYNYGSIATLITNQLRKKTLGIEVKQIDKFKLTDLKYHKICSNIILYCLCRAIKQFNVIFMENLKNLHYFELGSILPDQLKRIIQISSLFQVIHQQQKSHKQGIRSDVFKFFEKFKQSMKFPSKNQIPNILMQILKKSIKFSKKHQKLIQISIIIIGLVNKSQNHINYESLSKFIKLLLLVVPNKFQVYTKFIKAIAKL